MKSLEQLLADWENGALSAEELQQLKQLLATREARAELVDDWLLHETIYDTLRSSPKEAPAAVPQTRQPIPLRRRTPPRRLFRWLVWREARIPLRWPIGIAAVACLAMMVTFFYFEHAAVGSLSQLRSKVTVVRNGRILTAAQGQVLYPGDRIQVAAGGHANVAWKGEPTLLELTSETEVRLFNPMRGKRFSLSSGLLRASVAPQPWLRSMTILTPQAQAKVVGTQFSLSVTSEVSRLEVLEGAVRLRKTHLTALDNLAEVLVSAGETAAATPASKLQVQFLTGFLSSDVWAVPPGTVLTDAPNRGKLLTISPAPGDASNNIERLRGYLLAPATGEFTFWIASFKNEARAEVWLSNDDNPSHKRLIAIEEGSKNSVNNRKPGPGAALQADWNRSVSQKSGPQKLVQGKRYYIEVWHEGSGPSSLALGWRTPGDPANAQPKMADLNSLCPFVSSPPK